MQSAPSSTGPCSLLQGSRVVLGVKVHGAGELGHQLRPYNLIFHSRTQRALEALGVEEVWHPSTASGSRWVAA